MVVNIDENIIFMHLAQLLKGIVKINREQNPFITGLCQDSRLLKPGDLFFAYPGLQSDGRDFLNEVIAKGASAVLLEPTERQRLPSVSTPIIPVTHLTRYLGLIAARFYDHPSNTIPVVGITGTNGKTSCTHFLAQCLQQLHAPCAVIGTLGNGLYPQLKTGGLTTPDAVELQQLLANFRIQKASAVFMEVSSHRLAQQRLNGMTFSIAGFTNLTRDHLDYHGSMEKYAQTKRSFFDLPGVQQAVLNADDPYGKIWLNELAGQLPVMAYSLTQQSNLNHIPQIVAKRYAFNRQGLTAEVTTPWGNITIANPFLIGKFNLSNLLLVITLLKLLGYSLADIKKVVGTLKGVKGRMEAFRTANKPLVVIDYAHTPDALLQTLNALRVHCRGTLYCVFGCGGDRDKGKRPFMASIAEQFADHLVLTNDNPRFEDPIQIIQAMQKGLSGIKPIHVEQDRQRAITYAIKTAKAEDVVLVAGKGHETYQLIAGEKHPFSDEMEVRRLLGLDTA